jgi:protoheme IX farnesyltransferase
MSNEVAAFWSAFSILFYVLVYSMWLKRSTPQNIVIGGIAGSTPPVIGWAASVEGLSISKTSMWASIESVFDLGSQIPWFMFILIFLWTPPHFWALALYRSKEYGEVGVPMLPNVKGPERTIIEMKAYSILLIILSFVAPLSFGGIELGNREYGVLSWTIIGLTVWYASTVWRIDIGELPDETGRIASAASSFFVSMVYLALMFVVMVAGSFGQFGTGFGAIASLAFIGRYEFKDST